MSKISSFISLSLRVGLSMYVGVCVMYNCMCECMAGQRTIWTIWPWHHQQAACQNNRNASDAFRCKDYGPTNIDTHCECNINANIIDRRVTEKETRDTNTLDYSSPSSLYGDSTITHRWGTKCWRVTCSLPLFMQDKSSQLKYWPS